MPNIKEQPISTIDDITIFLKRREYDPDIKGYRAPYLYRGLPNDTYRLTTTLSRNCKNKQHILEESILRNFTKYAMINDPALAESKWRQMIMGQHHGLPTRILDWFYSSLVALHFATSSEAAADLDQHNGVVWEIDIEELNHLLPERYQEELRKEHAHLFTVKMLEKVVQELSQYDSDMRDSAMLLLEPSSIDSRIVNQYSFFSLVPKNIANVEDFLENHTKHTTKYIIDRTLRRELREMLDQMNINERMLFPGLDGTAKWIARHFYVSEENA